MARIEHPVLGSLEFEGGVTEGQLTVGGAPVEFDVWTDEQPTSALLDAVAVPIGRVEELHAANLSAFRSALAEDEEESSVELYRDHHLAEFESDELKQLFGTGDAAQVDDETCLKALRLLRIGAYPIGDEPHLTWDYGFGRELTQYVLSVGTDLSGRILAIDMES